MGLNIFFQVITTYLKNFIVVIAFNFSNRFSFSGEHPAAMQTGEHGAATASIASTILGPVLLLLTYGSFYLIT